MSKPEIQPLKSALAADLFAGVVVALVAIPQCMAFAAVAGLPVISGLYGAIVMGFISASISGSPRLIVGPVIAASSMLLGVLRTVAPDKPQDWPAIAGALAVLVGMFTILGAALNIGRFVRFVSRSVIVGLMAGSALLTLGSQLAPAMGLPSGTKPMLIGMIWNAFTRAGGTQASATLMAAGTMVLVLGAARIGPRFPAAFVGLVSGMAVMFILRRMGITTGLSDLHDTPWQWPTLTPWYSGPYETDLLVGAAAIALVGIIQTLAIAKGFAARDEERLDPKRELWALGLANIATGFLQGFPGSASFARSALCDLAGARTRLSGMVAAVATAIIVAVGGGLTQYITHASIAGLLAATAISMVDWRELLHVLRRDRYDRLVLGTTIVCVFFLPIHWAVLIGLAVSIAVFLRRVSEVQLFEMVAGESQQQFTERPIDEHTGRSAVTMLQLEGPVFFAHADELQDRLSGVLARDPAVLILRMRRTKQVDFSALTVMDRVFRKYLARGGHVIICGLQPELRETLRGSPLGKTIPADFMLQTTREVFGSAHMAIGLADSIVRLQPANGRETYRSIRSLIE